MWLFYVLVFILGWIIGYVIGRSTVITSYVTAARNLHLNLLQLQRNLRVLTPTMSIADMLNSSHRLYRLVQGFNDPMNDNITSLRCPSISPNGKQCGLPKNHIGNHQNGMAIPSWSTDQEQKEAPPCKATSVSAK